MAVTLRRLTERLHGVIQAMPQPKTYGPHLPAAVLLGFSMLLVTQTGCQVSVAGQTLPSPYFIDDDIQYFPAGPENKLANETAALKKAREESRLRQR
jgi:hypothetical protein